MPDRTKARHLAYTGPRSEVAELLPVNAVRILDVGCSNGALARTIASLRPGAEIFGVELDPELAAEAARHLQKVAIVHARDADLSDEFGVEPFDAIIFADVLEHLEDPWAVLQRYCEQLSPHGVVLASLPNVRHYSTLLSLVFRKRWPYRDRGIHDDTHLRFFAERNVRELFEGASLDVELMRRTYRLVENPHRINAVARYLAVPPLSDLLTFQYLVRARPAASAGSGQPVC